MRVHVVHPVQRREEQGLLADVNGLLRLVPFIGLHTDRHMAIGSASRLDPENGVKRANHNCNQNMLKFAQ